MEDETPPAIVVPVKPPKGEPPVNWISFFGFVIVTKADLLAAAAFLLSVATIAIQITTWLSGAQPTVYPPDVVYLFFDHYANNRTLVRLAGQLSFVNSAPAGHDAIVRSVTARIKVGPLDLGQPWLNFVTVSRDQENLLVTPREMAHPFPIPSGGAVSQMVSFAPAEELCGADGSGKHVPRDCVVDRGTATDIAFLNAASKTRDLQFSFSVQYVGRSKPQAVSCHVPVGPAFRQYLAENSWFSARCFAMDVG